DVLHRAHLVVPGRVAEQDRRGAAPPPRRPALRHPRHGGRPAARPPAPPGLRRHLLQVVSALLAARVRGRLAGCLCLLARPLTDETNSVACSSVSWPAGRSGCAGSTGCGLSAAVSASTGAAAW